MESFFSLFGMIGWMDGWMDRKEEKNNNKSELAEGESGTHETRGRAALDLKKSGGVSKGS